ncbi:MAG TPA: GNAT family N-acetyltransferase [Gemmataceae bacterium]|nr:GNAT family N-acetyltransferase [Gemmataceae bacterium]
MFTLRPAAETDVPVIRRLIRELAEYERLLHEAVVTEADLRANLFGPRPHAEVVIAEAASQVAGFALFFHTYSTFLGKPGLYIEDVYVRPEYRRRGLGTAFFRRLARLAVERECGRLEWSVLDWNEPALRFYRKLGAVPMSDWTVQRLVGDDLRRLADEAP